CLHAFHSYVFHIIPFPHFFFLLIRRPPRSTLFPYTSSSDLHHATPFMVLLAGLGTVLARWSGQHDVVVGVPITGRTDVGTENLIGFFVNTVPMRVHVSERSSFAELLGQVRAAALDGYEHAEAPFDRIVQQLPVMRVPGRTPVFQVALNVLDVFDRESLDGLVTELVPAQPPPSKFDLAL